MTPRSVLGDMFANNDDPIEIPIDGTLDLHTFAPRDVHDLVPDYLDECLKRGITQVRIIHGKGTGTLRRIVHSILDRHPHVIDYGQDDVGGGSWGATIVRLSQEPRRK